MCDLFLDEHTQGTKCDDPAHGAALERRREGAPAWAPLVRGSDAGGLREFLEGKTIHCGVGLELQGREYREDDYGEYVVALPTGTRVRYETAWVREDGAGGSNADAQPKQVVILHCSLAGHEFTARHEPWMRFRWPQRN